MMKRNRKGDTTDLVLSHQTSLVSALTAPVAGALRCRTQDMSHSSTTNNTATSLTAAYFSTTGAPAGTSVRLDE